MPAAYLVNFVNSVLIMIILLLFVFGTYQKGNILNRLR